MNPTTTQDIDHQKLVAEAFRDGAYIDFFPQELEDRWIVTASDVRGNALAEATFDTEEAGQRFIDETRATYSIRDYE
jgi:hypothetical protein